MPRYTFRCQEGHEFEVHMTYDEFDILKKNPEIQGRQLCKVVIYSCQHEVGGDICLFECLSEANIQIQSTPFKINLLEE